MSADAGPRLNAKELLDTMLGYLGFVVQIEETKNESPLEFELPTVLADRLPNLTSAPPRQRAKWAVSNMTNGNPA